MTRVRGPAAARGKCAVDACGRRLSNTNVSGDVSGWATITGLRAVDLDNTGVVGDVSAWSNFLRAEEMWAHLTPPMATEPIQSETNMRSDVEPTNLFANQRRTPAAVAQILKRLCFCDSRSKLQNTNVSGDVSSWKSMTAVDRLCAPARPIACPALSWPSRTHPVQKPGDFGSSCFPARGTVS